MIRGRIEFTGETDSDVETAVEAALSSIRGGFTSGFDRNETGSYHFELNEDQGEDRHEDDQARA